MIVKYWSYQEWMQAGSTAPLFFVAAADYDALVVRLAEAERDAALGRIAMRFVDRAGDVCDEDTARTICAEFYNAMANAVERQREARGLPAARLTDSAEASPE